MELYYLIVFSALAVVGDAFFVAGIIGTIYMLRRAIREKDNVDYVISVLLFFFCLFSLAILLPMEISWFMSKV